MLECFAAKGSTVIGHTLARTGEGVRMDSESLARSGFPAGNLTMTSRVVLPIP